MTTVSERTAVHADTCPRCGSPLRKSYLDSSGVRARRIYCTNRSCDYEETPPIERPARTGSARAFDETY